MKSLWPRFRRHLAGVLAAAVVLLIGCEVICQGKPDPYEAIPITREVKVEIENGKIKAYPPVSFVRPGGQLTFSVMNLGEGQTLEIDYKIERTSGGQLLKGPFARGAQGKRGRLMFTRNGPPVTLQYEATLRESMAWKYEITLRDANEVDLDVVDPVTVGRGDG